MAATLEQRLRKSLLGALALLILLLFWVAEVHATTEESATADADSVQKQEVESSLKQYELLSNLMIPIFGGTYLAPIDFDWATFEGLGLPRENTYSTFQEMFENRWQPEPGGGPTGKASSKGDLS
jgi:hypothetical protein